MIFFWCCKLVGADLLDEKVCEKLKSFISFLKIFFSGLRFILFVCWSDLQELKQSGKFDILVFLSNKLKGTVKEKWKGVYAESLSLQLSIATHESYIWCSYLEKHIYKFVKFIRRLIYIQFCIKQWV